MKGSNPAEIFSPSSYFRLTLSSFQPSSSPSPSPTSPVSPRFRSSSLFSSGLAFAFVFTFAVSTPFVCFAGAQPSKGELLSWCGSQSSQVNLCDSRRSRRQPLKGCSHPPFFLVFSSFVLEFYLVLAIENENPSTKPRSLTRADYTS